MGAPFQAVKDAAPSFTEAFCRRYLPTGKRVGQWWVVSTPWRVDRTPSLGVKITTGKWVDFGTSDHGDLSDLLSRLDRCTPAEAASRLALMMGVRHG